MDLQALPLVEVSPIASNSRKAVRASSARAVNCFAIHRHSAGPEISSSLLQADTNASGLPLLWHGRDQVATASSKTLFAKSTETVVEFMS
jgi:hypothetical protein